MGKILRFILLGVTIVILLFGVYLTQDFEKTPPTLYVNGDIITLNEKLPKADAMFVAEGIIQEIGMQKDMDTDALGAFNTVDLDGKTLLPGFIDPHTHYALSMFMASMHDLSGFKHQSNQEVWTHFEAIAKTKAKGEWIICKGLDPILVPDLKTPTLTYLDKIAPENPVVIFSQSLHSYWVNSNTLARAGVTKETPNPSEHSYYDKNEKGDFTGLVVEQEAFRPIIALLREEVFTAELLNEAASSVMAGYMKNGNTTIVSTGLTIDDSKPLILLKHLSGEKPSLLGNLLATLGFLPERQASPRHFVYLRHEMGDVLPEKRQASNDFYDIIGIKHWYDGSPYIGTMYLEQPYLASELTTKELNIPKGHRGKALVAKNELNTFIEKYHNAGYQIAIHTQGDAAIKEVVATFQELDAKLDYEQSRHRLEHCLLLPTSLIPTMKDLNITPSFHINHLLYYGDTLKTAMLGEERGEKILPLQSTQNEGIKYTLHADQPMFESQPFRLIQTAVERKTKSGKVIGEQEKVALMDALKALTIDAAWQIHREDKLGSLEKGKYADFILLDKNPFNIPTAELQDIQCLATFVNGNSTFHIQ